MPDQTTDGQPLREPFVTGSLCRQVGPGPCAVVDEAQTRTQIPVRTDDSEPVLWTDALPAELRVGAPRVIAYRVELRNAEGRTAGYSDPVFALAGGAPPPVSGLSARGTRVGIELQWTPVRGAGEVLLQRSEPPRRDEKRPEHGAPAPRGKSQKPGRSMQPDRAKGERQTPATTWLQAQPGNNSAAATIDGTVQEGVAYTYIAVRRQTATVRGRTLELRSAPSQPVSFAWRDVYPPAVPTGLTAIGFAAPAAVSGGAPGYAVDLVWQPVNDTRLAGYLVYRQALDASGEPEAPKERLTVQPVATPGFHDAGARPQQRYRYSVTAIDPKGNESPAAETVLQPEVMP